MATVDIPHLDLPFRFSSRGAAVVEQDSEQDVFNCVQAILRYPLGFRDDLPEFGIPQHTFTEGPLDLDAIKAQITTWEPRAETTMQETPDEFDASLREVLVLVSGGENG